MSISPVNNTILPPVQSVTASPITVPVTIPQQQPVKQSINNITVNETNNIQSLGNFTIANEITVNSGDNSTNNIVINETNNITGGSSKSPSINPGLNSDGTISLTGGGEINALLKEVLDVIEQELVATLDPLKQKQLISYGSSSSPVPVPKTNILA